jgi:hypothetical protein
VLNEIIDIDVKLCNRGKIEDYKTIQKSVNVITDMLDDAVKRTVAVDPKIGQRADIERERLVAERNLRHATSTYPISIATSEDV